MLRYLNVFLFCLLSGVFVACSAPTAGSSAQKPIDVPPIPKPDPGYTPPAGLPDKIEDILQSSKNYWTGKTQTGEWFYFWNKSSAGDNLFQIRIIKPASTGSSAVMTDFYGVKQHTNNPVAGGLWSGYFYLAQAGSDPNKPILDLNTRMECQMKFITLTKAEVKFFPKDSTTTNPHVKDYGTFTTETQ